MRGIGFCLLAALLSLALAACGPGDPTVSNGPPGVVPPERQEITQVGPGGVARLELPLEPGCLNPYLRECEGAAALSGVILESPLAVVGDGRYRPYLMESLPSFESGTLSENPFTVTYRLRSGVRWSDGEPLTSGDAAWTYRQARELGDGLAPPYAGWSELERVETPDARTVRLTFSAPRSDWRTLLTAPILPRHVYEGRDLGELPLSEGLLGSGPFVLEERTPEGMWLVRNENYWADEELPLLDGLEIRFGGPAAGALAAGQADFGVLGSRRAGEVEVMGDVQTAPAAAAVEQLLFDTGRLSDPRLRRAVAHAIDREALARKTGGLEVANGLFPPGMSRYHAPAWEEYAHDPALARRLARAAGAAGSLEIIYPAGDERLQEMAGGVARDLEAAGISARVRGVPARELALKMLPGAFDLALLRFEARRDGSLALHAPYSRSEALGESLRELDVGRRARLVREAQEEMAEELAVLPLVVRRDVLAWSNALYGPRPETPVQSVLWNVREWGFYR
ncbi:hypothetical protein E0L93_12640 [Rubrobacter taiwanensis]|uniref:Solute-binding protein family 5 domain-containing protein n=1 Tax=Rubrobacter taiwanensis TaxID=185139 RepID=A0A4R1BEY6_9ACTN|nr:ABC transporter substrate-binding protein [Rubrobacter taiwanensis]TCJ15657.1 hypothetical protein E0L93_12640 [Rubrobacter taiwanensis]